jgi:hypothetical protein
VSYSDTLIKRVITLIVKHRKPSSPKSIAVLIKVMDAHILGPKHTVAELKGEIRAALKSTDRLSEIINLQHTEAETRLCLTNLLAALEEQGSEAE